MIPVLLLAVACHSSSYVTDVYQEDDVTKLSFDRIAAIAITDDADDRKIVEDEMAKQIGPKGVASYTIVGMQDLQDADTVRAMLAQAGFDGAVTMELLSLNDEPIDPRGNMSDPYKRAYGAAGAGTGLEKVARIETQIVSVKENRVLWSAETKTFDPSDFKKVVASVAGAIRSSLHEDKLID